MSHSQWTKVAIQKRPTNPTGGPASLNGECRVSPGFGMFGKMSGSLLTALTDEQANLLRRELGPKGNHIRGISSPQRLPRQASTCKSAGLRGRGRQILPATSPFATASTVRGRTCRTASLMTCSHMATLPIPQGPKLRSRLASPPMPKMKTAYLS